MTSDLLPAQTARHPDSSLILRAAIVQHAVVARFVSLLRDGLGDGTPTWGPRRRRATIAFVESVLLAQFEPEESRLLAALAPRAGFEISEEATTRTQEWERIAEIVAALSAVDAAGDEKGAATLWDWNLRVLLRVLSNRLVRERQRRRVFIGAHRLTRLMGDRIIDSILRDFETGRARSTAERHLDEIADHALPER